MMNMFNYSPLKLNNTRFAYILCGIMCLILALPGWAQSMPPWIISPQYHFIQPLSADRQRSSYMMAGDRSTRTLEIPFPYNESQTNDADVVFELMSNGVVLWHSSKSLINDTKTSQSTNSRFSQDTEKKNVKDNKSKGGISASCPSSIKANAKNIYSVPVTVTNRSNVALNVKISSSTGLSTTIVVPAGKSKTVTFSINDVKKGKQCTFTATPSAGSSTCKTTLNPYFALQQTDFSYYEYSIFHSVSSYSDERAFY